MLVVDAHVHIYPCYDLEQLFDRAWENFQAAVVENTAGSGDHLFVLLLAEGARENWFRQQVEELQEAGEEVCISPGWQAGLLDSGKLLRVSRREDPGQSICLAPGFQTVTEERLELLALLCEERIADGLPLERTVTVVHKAGGIPVLPWGAGKWLGRRGRLVRAAIAASGINVLPGDNGGRPVFWPQPGVIRRAETQGVPVLSGSDPLPLSGEEGRVGSFGCVVPGSVPGGGLTLAFLRERLSSRQLVKRTYGRLQGTGAFLKSQLLLRKSSKRSRNTR